MKSGKASDPGWEKLQRFCKKAQEYGTEFTWSDTCCIDKSSSTELNKSICSMFHWYKNSAICIVHLAQSDTIDDIMDDEWTRRGWTMQELLAPEKIKFFNKHWMPMMSNTDDKTKQLLGILTKATCIPFGDLQEFHPGPFKVDERMVWAARHKTTREEDVAYSLMGIFDINDQPAHCIWGRRRPHILQAC